MISVAILVTGFIMSNKLSPFPDAKSTPAGPDRHRCPTRFMSSKAGTVLRAVPITDIVEERVARVLLLARRR
jgi:hypothetical protein